jgi:hypothetical protein
MAIKKISRGISLLLVLALSLLNCSACRAQQKSTASGASTPDYVVGGEHFAKRTINDTQQGNMPAAIIYLPKSWTMQSKITWNYAWTENPVSFSLEADNPANAEAYFCYPMLKLESLQVPQNMQKYAGKMPQQGERMAMGSIYMNPMQPLQGLGLYVKKLRGTMPNFKFIGKADLPDLAKQLGLDPLPNQHGVAVEISYDLNGKPVEEAFFGVFFLAQGANTGVNAGQIKQTNWGYQALTSFRAPAGTLDKRLTVFAAISKSLHPLPAWTARSTAIAQQLVAIFNQKLKQGYDQLRAAQATMEQVMKNDAAFQKGIDAQMMQDRQSSSSSSGGGGGGGGGGRSVQDKWDDLYRGVDTVNDPTTGGTKQLSNLESDHWGDGFGNFFSTNDHNADPNGNIPGNWQRLSEAP